MAPRRTPLAALKTAFDAVFRHDLAIRRSAHGLRVVLQARGPDAAAPAPTAADLERLRLEQELADARADLTRLLDEDTASRAAMRHLAAVEHALGRIGWQAFERLPLDVLQRAHSQLEDRVTNWSARGLAGLRSRLAVSVAARSAPQAAASSPVSGRGRDDTPPVAAAKAIDQARRRSASASPAAAPRAPAEPELDDADRALLAAYAALGVGPGAADETPPGGR